MSRLKAIAKKLDLTEHIESLTALFAREKSVVMSGDITLHFKFIKSLDSVELPQPPQMPPLKDALLKLSKEGILDLDTIYLFIKQIYFFNRLKSMSLPEIWTQFIESIEVPKEILEISRYFNDDGELEPSIVIELKDIKDALRGVKEQKRELLRRVVNSNKLSSFLIDNKIHLYYGQEAILVRGGFSKAIDANIIGRSSSGFFYIVPNSLERLKSKESELLDKEQEIYAKYAREFSKILHKWVRFLKFLDKSFDRVDHYFARALLLRQKDLSLILPKRDKKVILDSFKHPAISAPKPIDIRFEKKIMLVTGVNAGGKTMLLKSILGAVFMSRYLIPFACNPNRTEVGYFGDIIAILDDPQSVKNDISTFAGRMVEFKKLFSLKNAIIGVDEIELGTDADEAAALFRSILEELTKRDLYFVITTHHKRLASIMASKDEVELIAAIYDEKNQAPTYTYLSGSIGKSYAFETALRYGVNRDVVERARRYLGEDKEQLNQLIEKSTQLEISMKKKIKEAEERLKSASKRERQLNNLKERLIREQKDKLNELEKRYQDSLKLLKEALKKSENPDARRLINKAYDNKKDIKIEEEKKEIELKVGKRVKYRGKEATILTIRGKDIFIETVDGIKLKVPKNSLEEIKEQKKRKRPKPKVSVDIERPQNGKIVLKILGYRADEAIEEVQDFISNALLHGFSEVEIIHGTGGGVLAKVVSELLRDHPRVKSFERAKGNFGATIVKL